jgi:hypothetical protein
VLKVGLSRLAHLPLMSLYGKIIGIFNYSYFLRRKILLSLVF